MTELEILKRQIEKEKNEPVFTIRLSDVLGCLYEMGERDQVRILKLIGNNPVEYFKDRIYFHDWNETVTTDLECILLENFEEV